MINGVVKRGARALATACVLPAIASFRLRSLVIGQDRALHASSQALAMVPGLAGRYLRVAFLRRVIAHCDPSATIEFGTILSKVGARIGKNVYVGPSCNLGLAILEDDVLLAAGVHVPSGPNTHGTGRLDIPIREQPGQPVAVRIGAGSWIGSVSVVMADVGANSVVGAGSVVTRSLPAYCFAAGVPARVLGDRRAVPAREDAPATRTECVSGC